MGVGWYIGNHSPLAAGLGGGTGIAGSHQARGGHKCAAGERRAAGLGDGCAEHVGLIMVNCLVRWKVFLTEIQMQRGKMGGNGGLYIVGRWDSVPIFQLG